MSARLRRAARLLPSLRHLLWRGKLVSPSSKMSTAMRLFRAHVIGFVKVSYVIKCFTACIIFPDCKEQAILSGNDK